MKNLLQVTALVIACSALAVLAVPVPEPNPDPAPAPAPEPKTDIELMKIPLEGDQELDVITLVDSGDQKINERNKRTIGILRELFPTISQILDQKIQMITSYLFRTIGPILLRSGLGGGAAGGNAGGRGGSTDDDFDADFDDDDDDKATDSGKSDSGSSSDEGGQKVSISLPTFPPSSDDNDDDDGEKTTTAASSFGSGSDENEIRKRAVAARLQSAPSSSSTFSGSDPTTTALSADTDAPSTITATIGSRSSGNSAEQDSATTTQNAQFSTDSNLV